MCYSSWTPYTPMEVITYNSTHREYELQFKLSSYKNMAIPLENHTPPMEAITAIFNTGGVNFKFQDPGNVLHRGCSDSNKNCSMVLTA